MRYGPSSSRQRPHDRGSPSRDTATSRKRESGCQTLRRQSDDDPEVARSGDDGRCRHGSERAALDRSDAGGGGDHRRLSAAYPAAAGRLPLRASAHDPASDPLQPAPVPAATRHQPLARGRRRQAREEALQAVSDRLLPRRYRTGQHRRGQAVPIRGDRSHQQVRLRSSG